MTALLVLAAGIAAALAACRFIWREPVATGDLAIGLVGGLIGLIMARLFSGDGWGLALPVLVACAGSLALSAVRQSPPAGVGSRPVIYDGQTRRLERQARRR